MSPRQSARESFPTNAGLYFTLHVYSSGSPSHPNVPPVGNKFWACFLQLKSSPRRHQQSGFGINSQVQEQRSLISSTLTSTHVLHQLFRQHLCHLLPLPAPLVNISMGSLTLSWTLFAQSYSKLKEKSFPAGRWQPWPTAPTGVH